MKLTAFEIAEYLQSELIGPDATIEGVSIDSRSTAPGELFVPIVAERDGHEFIVKAVEKGAALYLTAKQPESDVEASAVMVEDTSQALESLGALARSRFDGQLIGVTGSVGKTTTKDLIYAACSSHIATYANEGSFNNEIGVPLTLLRAPEDTKVLVSEMGARGVGHIQHLCEYVKPTVGVITKVASAHTELFGSIEAVAQGKGELAEAIDASGTVVLNADDPHVIAMEKRTQASVLTYGIGRGDLRAGNIVVDGDLSVRFTLFYNGESYEVPLSFKGEHMVPNALAALGASIAVGVDLQKAIAGIARAVPSKARMDVRNNAKGQLIINDAYNANPVSVRAALKSLQASDASTKVAVLGLMAELGDEGPQEHSSIAEEAADTGVRVIAVNCPAYGDAAEHVKDKASALAVLEELSDDAAILVKGSNSLRLDELAHELLK